jgi:Cytochrome P450
MDLLVSVLPALRSLPSLSIDQSLLILFTGYLFTKVLFSKKKGPLPPGPRGLPLLGNIFQIPRLQWLKYTEWQKEFGPIFSLNFAGKSVIILNTPEVAADLLGQFSYFS